MKRMSVLAALAACVLVSGAAHAKLQTKVVTYKQGTTPLKGLLVWDDAAKGKRPGVLVVHEWWGNNEHSRKQAERYAQHGYVAFALDMYGQGKVAKHPEDAQAMATQANKDPAVVKARFDAALAQLEKDQHVDPEKIAAVGYCMGGSIALSMAAVGEDLDAVSVFHAGLKDLPAPKKGEVKARVLVNNGEADPMAPPQLVQAFTQQWKDSGAQFELINYPGAKHAFTNPAADKVGMPALAYDPEADQKSFDATLKMFREVFGAPQH